jgi:hypothetical protein
MKAKIGVRGDAAYVARGVNLPFGFHRNLSPFDVSKNWNGSGASKNRRV